MSIISSRGEQFRNWLFIALAGFCFMQTALFAAQKPNITINSAIWKASGNADFVSQNVKDKIQAKVDEILNARQPAEYYNPITFVPTQSWLGHAHDPAGWLGRRQLKFTYSDDMGDSGLGTIVVHENDTATITPRQPAQVQQAGAVPQTGVAQTPSQEEQKNLDNALWKAVLHQNIPEINTLIAQGADVNVNSLGTPVHIANLPLYFTLRMTNKSTDTDIEILKILLDHGANPNRSVLGLSFGRTFIDYMHSHSVQRNVAPEIINMIEQAAAKQNK